MKKFVYKLSNGDFVHPTCREPYQEARAKGSAWPGISAVIHADQQTGELPPNNIFPEGRFTLCAHCKKPILDSF